MKGLSVRVASLVAALVCGTTAGLLVLPFGLVLAEFVILPLTFCGGALFALGASWEGTLLTSDRTSSRIAPIVLVSEATAVVVGATVFVAFLVPAVWSLVLGALRSNAAVLGAGMVIVALGSTWAAWRFRRPGRNLRRDVTATFGLAGLALLFLVGTLFLASIFGMVGAWAG